MACFDVVANPDVAERNRVPFFLDVQNDHLKGLLTRVVVPLWDAAAVPLPISELNPAFEVAGRRVVMDTPAMRAVPSLLLKSKAGSLDAHRLTIQNAIDVLFGSD